ncbi:MULTISPECIES: FKBP-type peptidyl-prolyl cis-trans isomerase [unclassified Carboxylicivirga]|uniref:FKBP-type peptidyl-prolyl cis-trans isomerase n=1 Tax=Carboxylicivirga TaxID=1628153 RepID=UPI003D353911
MPMVFKNSRLLLLSAVILLGACNSDQKSTRRVTKDMLLEMNRQMVSAESRVIEQYIADHELDMKKSSTGYYYRVSTPAKGDTIKPRDVVTLAYTTRLLDGTVCYSSATEGMMTFTVGKAQVEAGLEQFVQQLGQGAIGQIIMPPYLAHGIAGDGDKIPRLAILMMDIEVLKVQRP